MKNFYRGFTIVELLLCIFIIGIITAMGMTITRRSAEKAYNLYYYTGYINLYNSIADARAKAIENIPEIMNHAGILLQNRNPMAPQGGEADNLQALRIDMTVPQQRTRANNGEATVAFVYINNDEGLLVPLVPEQAAQANGVPNLQDRRDLLPVYIDNGVVGRVIPNGNNNSYVRPEYFSYREAYCRLHNNQNLRVQGIDNVANPVIDCAGIPADARLVNSGFLKVADPRYAR